MAAPRPADIVSAFHADRRFKPRGWNRDALVAFFARKSGDAFLRLPAYSDAELSPESIARNAPKGWLVPAECFSRVPDVSQKNSLRAFVRDNVLPHLPAYGGPVISPENVEMHLVGNGEHAFVMIFRKK